MIILIADENLSDVVFICRRGFRSALCDTEERIRENEAALVCVSYSTGFSALLPFSMCLYIEMKLLSVL